MRLSWSVASSSRKFSQRMRNARSRLVALEEAFGAAALQHPIHEAILVGITNDREPSYFAEIPNHDGFFQVLAGCDADLTEDELVSHIFAVLRRAMLACPFSNVDHEALELLFSRFEPERC